MNYGEAAVAFFKTTNGQALWKKYSSKTLVREVADAMAESLPTIVAASLAFERLVENGDIERTDGKNEDDDNAELIVAAQKRLADEIAKAEALPLTSSEIERFASLSQFELSKLYWGADGDAINGFAVRYRMAISQHGFREPAHYAGGLR
jgi:hypothetical protein